MMARMGVPWGDRPLESGAARVWGSGGVAGAGFLIAPDLVCTCAHVVADALGLPRDLTRAPEGTVRVEFPLLREEDGTIPEVLAEVVSWQPVKRDDSGDVALLRLDRTVSNARPVPLVDGSAVWGHTFRVYGFPEGATHGVWASGTLRAAQGAGWLQMDAEPDSGSRIGAGFSGSAVWDDAQGGVVGMTVAAGRGGLAGTAYLVPSAALVDEEVLRPRCPFRGLAVFGEEDAEFFHGRLDDAERLAKAVGTRPLTILAGPSGCGKSSLVRAGLLPALRARGTTVSVLRPVQGVRPRTALAQAVVPVLEPAAGEVERLRKSEELVGLLDDGARDGREQEVAAGLRAALGRRGGSGGHLIFVDQLEEYAAAEPVAARELFTLLAAVAGAPDEGIGSGTRVVATARPESLDVLVTPETSGALSDAVIFLAALSAKGLRQAVTGPVDATLGLWLEPGLAERIVEDAAGEPGRMPLTEFALTRLWERRERSMLTHAAYQELGGVAGALVGYAEDAFRAHVPASEEPAARRLFVQLARPDDRGGFTRRPTPVADLDTAAVAIARRLAPGKLVVFGRTSEGTEIVDLAHEALTRLWPRLRGWLEDSREFRGWQEQLRRDLARWEDRSEEAGGLLRGRLLAEAEDWLKRRPEDITSGERAYIQAGRRHQRRGVRAWQAAVAALAALLLTASTLAAVAVQNRRETEAKLRTLASRTLADASDKQSERAPGTAVQLALAAWHTEHTPQARAALLRQYVRGQYLRGGYRGLWRGRAQKLDATPDGRTMVVRSKPSGFGPQQVAVVTGVPEGKPRHYTLRGVPEGDTRSAVSPDGRHYAIATPEGGVLLWRLDGTSRGPRVLARDVAGERNVNSARLDFSADSRRLLRLLTFSRPLPEDDGREGLLGAWDTGSGQPLPMADEVIPRGVMLSDAAFGVDPDTVLLLPWFRGKNREVVVRDLGTGRSVRKISSRTKAGSLSLGGGGAYVIESDSSSRSYLHDLAKGSSARLPGSSTTPDATGVYLFDTKGVEKGGYSEIALTRPTTGETYRTRVPVDSEPQDLIAVVSRGGGGVRVLAPVGDTLMVVEAHREVAREPDKSDIPVGALSSDGRRLARVSHGRLEVMDLVSGDHRTAALPRTRRNRDWLVTWTARSTRLVAWQPNGTEMSTYAARDLADRVDVRLDMGPDTDKELGTVDAAEPLYGGDVAVLTAGGALLRVDPERGVQIGPPLWADRTPLDSGKAFAGIGQIRARPGHPDQVAVAGRNGAERGRVALWDIRARKRTGTLSGDRISTVYSNYGGSSMAFSPDGEELVVKQYDGFLRRWGVAEQRAQGPRIAVDSTGDVVGVTDEGTVVTFSYATDLELWEAATADRVGVIRIPGGRHAAVVRGNRLTMAGDDWRQSFDLRPETWFKDLCEGVGRDYTDDERKHQLPPGTPSEPPCTGTGP
ncbi:Trypsin-like peptidase domain-containing protein [Streptomyces sp. MnatMP-M27]|nr:Trypsin-like peptidase domain-containing protein [Streptomyces sp. MnatMP-M27]